MSTSILKDVIDQTEKLDDVSLAGLCRTRSLRFAVGVTACAAVAFGFRWPLFHLAPVMTAFFLAQPVTEPPLHLAGKLFYSIPLAFAFGLLFAHLLLPYPLVYIPLLVLALFHIYHGVSRGGSPMQFLIPLLALIILPVLSLNQPSLAAGFLLNLSFVATAVVAVCAYLLAHIVLPEPGEISTAAAASISASGYSGLAARTALKSCIVVAPIAVLFMCLNWADELLVLIFAAIVSLSPEASKGRQKGAKKLIANLIGAVATVVFYWLLVAVPEYHFFVALMFVATLAFGSAIFSGGKMAKYMSSACIALLVLIGGSMTEHSNFMEEPFKRIILVILAALYMVAALEMLDSVFARSEQS